MFRDDEGNLRDVDGSFVRDPAVLADRRRQELERDTQNAAE